MCNQSLGDGVVVCSCDHLTNFAILMSPVETVGIIMCVIRVHEML